MSVPPATNLQVLGDPLSWADQYERMRRQGLGLGPRRPAEEIDGMTMFLRQGSAAWMRGRVGSETESTKIADATQPAFAHRDRGEVTRLLATMVGAAAAQVRA